MNRFINEDKFQQMCLQHEVSQQFANYLRQLIDYKVIIIADDSGSMANKTDYGERRWDELCRFVRTVFAVTEVVENSPLDVCFLNRASITRVQQLSEIQHAFQDPPKGYTPIVPILRQVLSQIYDKSYKGRIVIICTDGEPTDERNNVNIGQLRQVLERERAATDYVTFLACTDDDDAIGYLNKWDVELARVDVVDDYQNERKEVLAAQGRDFRFSYADYVVKIVLGSVVPALDRLDERPSFWSSKTKASRHGNLHQSAEVSCSKNNCAQQ